MNNKNLVIGLATSIGFALGLVISGAVENRRPPDPPSTTDVKLISGNLVCADDIRGFRPIAVQVGEDRSKLNDLEIGNETMAVVQLEVKGEKWVLVYEVLP